MHYWFDAFKDAIPDMSLINDALYGSEQMTFSNRYSDVRSVRACVLLSSPMSLADCAPQCHAVLHQLRVQQLGTRARQASKRGRYREPMALVAPALRQ